MPTAFETFVNDELPNRVASQEVSNTAGYFPVYTGTAKLTSEKSPATVLSDIGGAAVVHTHVASDVTDFGEAAQDAVGTIMADTSEIDFTYSDATESISATLIANSIVVGRLTATATDVFFGRDTAGAGAGEEITVAAARTMLNVADGANAYVHPNHSGDVTSVADGATTIANNAVTLAKMADAIASSRIVGSGASGAGVDYVEIALGTNLSMSGTTLNATGGGASALGDLSDVTLTTPATRALLMKPAGDWIDDVLIAADIPDLDTAKLTAGILPVARGGTGLEAIATSKILTGNAALPMTVTDLAYSASVLKKTDAGDFTVRAAVGSTTVIGEANAGGGGIDLGDGTLRVMAPATTLMMDLGSASKVFNNAYLAQLNVDNVRIDGNAITTQDTNGDLTLTPNGDGEINCNGRVNVVGVLNVGSDSLTISGGVVTLGNTGSLIFVDTEGSTSSDQLDRINGGRSGDWIMVFANSDTRTVTLADDGDFFKLDGNCVLDSVEDSITLICFSESPSSKWQEVNRSLF